VTSVNDIPVVNPQSLTMTGGTSLPVVLTGTDADADPLSFVVATPPTHGTLSGIEPNLIYTPLENYVGTDSFTFTAADADNVSSPATITITVNEVLKNGSFEIVTGTSPNLVPSFWTATGKYEIATSTTPRPAIDGTRLAVFNNGTTSGTPNLPATIDDASLTQSFATTPGKPYKLFFSLGVNGSSAQQKVRVTITGSSVIVNNEQTITGPGSGATLWSSRTISFTANSALPPWSSGTSPRPPSMWIPSLTT
jgi:large repetitive protein